MWTTPALPCEGIGRARSGHYLAGMHLHTEMRIAVPASRAWAVLGERFGHIGEWATPIERSSLAGDPRSGAVRTCHIARFGPVARGVVRERLVEYEPAAMRFIYEAVEGLPSFIGRASNRWTVAPDGPEHCFVSSHAELQLLGAMRLLALPLRWRMRADSAKVLKDLRHFLERGEAHPRKRRALSGAERAS